MKSRLHRARVVVRERVAPALQGDLPGEEPGPGCRDVVEAFSRRLEGEIEPGLCAELESHLKTCPACQSRCDSLKSTLKLCRTASAAPVPEDVVRSVRAALKQFLAASA
jgi:RNA polymerase sigma-70 factor (ECF subfamily)